MMVKADTITRMQTERTQGWHGAAPEPRCVGLMALAMAQHRANFDLWHEEDKARNPQAADAEIARVKHAIDGLNQRRNDLVQQMDEWLLREFGEQNGEAPLHSETPGLMIDRLSILALKIFHTEEESVRESASAEHRTRNRERLAILIAQRDDLAGCLDALLDEVRRGKRRFKLYCQLKMYNDPELNPVLYGQMAGGRSSS